MNIEDASDQALRDELEERARERTMRERGEVESCEDCARFKPWTSRRTMPEDYNPCSKRHAMRFRMPEPWEDPHDGGFYRLVCSDRKERPPPPPEPVEPPPKPGPRGWPNWHLRRKPI
ncbi:hypothetical protein [Pseudomonas juntendi]|uniref:hypothetical protein n=1 Tax=Pseudomonas juntendi TaxID=2666183 RepID=UPI001F447BD8|nr:hypothetical protein [Pseudomonas juntendi]MCO7058297.1 hypothetical protein [Pseudomonas juntendi]UJM15187.1 hypothetical protein L1P09_26000 [Pseudomonas juntendi]